MSITCNLCKQEFRTQKGLELHQKVFHSPEPEKAQVKESSKEPPKKATTKVTEIDVDAVIEAAQADYKAMVKRKRKEPISLEVGQKLSANKFMKIMKHDPVVHITRGCEKFRAKAWTKKTLSSWIGKDSFTITVAKEQANSWFAYRIESKRLKISWKEGPFKGAHTITYPILVANGC